jgi:hypothetical protein
MLGISETPIFSEKGLHIEPAKNNKKLLGKKDDGHALAVHWMHGRAVVAYPKKVALINVEVPTGACSEV